MFLSSATEIGEGSGRMVLQKTLSAASQPQGSRWWRESRQLSRAKQCAQCMGIQVGQWAICMKQCGTQQTHAGRGRMGSEMSEKINVSEIKRITELVLRDKCAKCDGELDTGFECNKCGWDGSPFVHMLNAPEKRQ